MNRKTAKEIRREAWAALGENGQYLRYVAAYMLLSIIGAVAAVIMAVIFDAGIVASGIVPYFMPGGHPELGLFLDPAVMLPILSTLLVVGLLSFYPIGFCGWGQAAMAIASARRGITVGHALSGWGHGWRMGWIKSVKWLYLLPWTILAVAPACACVWRALPALEQGWEGFLESLLALGRHPGVSFGTLLLLVPLCVKSLSYAMVEFVAVDNSGWTASQCIAESSRLMHGHRWRYACLLVSFFWWALLAFVASRIKLLKQLAQVLLLPYIDTARAVFYEELLDGEGR